MFRKSVEEASRTIEKPHRRVTTHVNKNNAVEEDDDEEEEEENNVQFERSNIHREESNLLPRRHFQRESE